MPWSKTAVLLDDDDLVLRSWALLAKAKGVQLATFHDSESLLAALPAIGPETDFFLDSKLKDGTRGEELARELLAKGFKNLYLATGLPPDAVPAMPWIKGILAKDPPW